MIDYEKHLNNMKPTSRGNYSLKKRCKCGKPINNKTIRCKKCNFKGNRNTNWKEGKKSYIAIHQWVNRNKRKPTGCNSCLIETKRLEAHNISGQYKRDIKDYVWLCTKCHCEVDQKGSRKIRERGEV